MSEWDKLFLRIALTVADKSKDNSSKVGCCFVGPDKEVLSLGYNGFCRGADDSVPDRYVRPSKYLWTEHAERNSIYNAARVGVSLKNSTCYSTHFPCADCFRGIIQCGCSSLVFIIPTEDFLERLGTQFDFVTELALELKFPMKGVPLAHLRITN